MTLQEDGGRSHATLAAMLAATDANTAARAAQLLAAVFWHSRAAEARDAAAEGLALKRAPDATAVAAAALLPPPPPAGASAGVGAADALVRALRAPATARGAARVLVDTVAQLVATALACKQDLGPQGSARSTGQHLLVVVATLAAAVQWLRVLQHSAQRAPVLCLVRLLLETLTVPRPSADNDSARHHSGRATTSEATQPPAPYLSPISQFLQGARLCVLAAQARRRRVRLRAVQAARGCCRVLRPDCARCRGSGDAVLRSGHAAHDAAAANTRPPRHACAAPAQPLRGACARPRGPTPRQRRLRRLAEHRRRRPRGLGGQGRRKQGHALARRRECGRGPALRQLLSRGRVPRDPAGARCQVPNGRRGAGGCGGLRRAESGASSPLPASLSCYNGSANLYGSQWSHKSDVVVPKKPSVCWQAMLVRRLHARAHAQRRRAVQALQDSDTRVRFVAAEFMLSRAKSHKPEEVRGALQALLRMAQSSKDGALVENPYVQLQAYLANGLLTIDDL